MVGQGFTNDFISGIKSAFDYLVLSVLTPALEYIMNNNILRHTVLFPLYAAVFTGVMYMVFYVLEYDTEGSLKTNVISTERLINDRRIAIKRQVRAQQIESDRRERAIREQEKSFEDVFKRVVKSRKNLIGKYMAKEYFVNNPLSMSVNVGGRKYFNEEFGNWYQVNWGRLRKDGVYRRMMAEKGVFEYIDGPGDGNAMNDFDDYVRKS